MQAKKNVLVLEAGGGAGIATIKALKKSGVAHVVAADMNPYTAAFSLADSAVCVPKASDPQYARVVHSILDNREIDIVLPTFEFGFAELGALNDPRFVTDFKSALLCKNKYQFGVRCAELGLPVPQSRWLSDVSDIDAPVYIKPYDGVGSRDNFVAESNERFHAIKNYVTDQKNFLVQDLLHGEHWGVDVVVDRGVYVTAVCRKDLQIVHGNPVTVSVESNDALVVFAETVQKALRIQSTFNLEVFEHAGSFTINEINMRFGSGTLFSVLAGCDVITHEVTHDRMTLGPVTTGVYSRYSEEIRVDPERASTK